MLAASCYALLLAAWIVDLLTPQLFVASILYNGPIALSTQALRPGVTVRLALLAEIANIVGGYVNAAQAGGHWDPIAVGDRALAAASFVLVGALTLRAQANARRAGEASERERQIASERALRHAMENVRASLNMELVLRAAVREAYKLTRADRVALITRESSLRIPDRYEMRAGDDDVRVERSGLSPELASIVERARDLDRIVFVDSNDPIGRMLGEAALIAVLVDDGTDTILLVSWQAGTPTDEQKLDVQAFVDNLRVALQQARLFVRLAEQNEQIAQQKDALAARSDVIRDIVYALAHDLRTPLAAAEVTMGQAISGAYGDLPVRYQDILRTSIASNADLRRLVETLLLVARYESGEDSRAFARASLSQLAERVVADLRPVANVKGVALELRARDDISAVVDADEVRRAFANLLANAIEATPEGGRVAFDLQSNGERIVASVVDDGFGVSPERRGALFQRFGGVRAGAGTGLGLYIVRRIAEKYGGKAGYEPLEPRGSRFFIELPVEPEPV